MFKDNPKLKKIFLAGFLLSLHFALTAYIGSSFLSSFIGEKSVGFVYAFGSIISILALLIAPKILRYTGGYKFLLWIAGLNIFSLLSLSFIKSAWGAIPIFILYLTLNTLIVFSLDELLKIFSKDSSTGKIRGLYLTVISSAWVMAQLFSGKILGSFPFSKIYLVAFSLMILFFLVSFFWLKGIPDPKYDETKGVKHIVEFFKNKNLARSYKINFLLQFFYSWMVIYTPIYLYAHLGFDWKEIGIIFAIMLTPFVLLQFPLGLYSDKIGERKMLMLGFVIASLATLSLFFITKHEIWVWAIALFATRVGAATIEVMSDVYFFKHIKAENNAFIGVYRNASSVAYIVGPLVALIIFAIMPSFNFIYLVLGALMLCGIYLSSKIDKSDI